MRIAWASNVNHGNYVDWCFMTVRSRSNMMRFLNSTFIYYIVNGLFEFQSNNIPLKKNSIFWVVAVIWKCAMTWKLKIFYETSIHVEWYFKIEYNQNAFKYNSPKKWNDFRISFVRVQKYRFQQWNLYHANLIVNDVVMNSMDNTYLLFALAGLRKNNENCNTIFSCKSSDLRFQKNCLTAAIH